MANHPGKLVQFFQELKRRKMLRGLTMYGATAFVIMEAADIMLPRLGLPDWTVTLIIVLLIAGLPLTLVFSWLFDFTREGIKKTEAFEVVSEKVDGSGRAKKGLRWSDALIAVLFIAVCVLLYPKIFPGDRIEKIRDEDGRIAIAVLPFENQTGDTTLNWFQRGISSLLINGLGSSPELAVRDDHIMHEVLGSVDQVFTAGFSRAQARTVAGEVQAQAYVSGSFHGRDGKYWILANLVNTESGDIILTKRVEGDLKSSEYLELANDLCDDIKDHLEIEELEKNVNYDFREAYTASADAYRLFIEGMDLLLESDYHSAIESLERALEIDSTFTFASFYIAFAYNYMLFSEFQNSLDWTKKAYGMKENLPQIYQSWIELWYIGYFGKDLQAILKNMKSLEESDIESRLMWFDLANTYCFFLGDIENGIRIFEKIEEINRKRGGDWEYENYYLNYGRALHLSRNHEKENEIFETSLALFPNTVNKREIYYHKTKCALSRGDTSAGEDFLAKYLSAKRELGQASHNIEFYTSNLYFNAEMYDEADLHLNKAIELNPDNAFYPYSKGVRLVERGERIEEGLEIINANLDLYPDDIWAMYNIGLAYSKQGKYEEALVILRKADALDSGYNYIRENLIREAELALADQ